MRERETDPSDFARPPQTSRHVREKHAATYGKNTFGQTNGLHPWSNEECENEREITSSFVNEK
jgi:hypothetical protein